MLGGFVLEGPDPACDGLECAQRGEHLDVAGVVRGPQPQRGRDDRADGEAAEAGTDRLGGGDDQGVQLALAVGGRLDRSLAGSEQDLQRRSLRAGARLREVGARQGVAGGADSVDGVGLRPGAAGRSCGPVELDDQLVALGEMRGQTGAVAAGAFHRPRAHPPVLVRELDQRFIALGIGANCELRDDRPGRCGDHCGGVGVLVGVDADDDLDLFCEHGQPRSPLTGTDVAPVRFGRLGRTVMGHASSHWRSSS